MNDHFSACESCGTIYVPSRINSMCDLGRSLEISPSQFQRCGGTIVGLVACPCGCGAILLPEEAPDCTCYELTGGHQAGCPFGAHINAIAQQKVEAQRKMDALFAGEARAEEI